MPKKRTADEYVGGDGFIVEDDDDGEEEVRSTPRSAQKQKKQKTASSGDSGDGAGGGGGGVPGGGEVGADGNEYWEISGKRRLQLSQYNGKRMINIREYYEKGGEMLPGKKGISLTTEQFDAVISLLPHVETVLAGKGHQIARPDYSGAGDGGEAVVKAGEKKKNFEETSEEE